MKSRYLVIAAFSVTALLGSTVAAEAHGSRVYFGFSFGVGAPYYGPPVYTYYPGYYPVYRPYYYPGYCYRPYYPPPVAYRSYYPYGPRVYRGYAPYYGRYGRGHVHHAPQRYAHRH